MTDSQLQQFGEAMKERRLALDMTQQTLAERANCATISIRRIEAGTLRPSLQLAEQIAEALAIPVDEREAFVRLARNGANGEKLAILENGRLAKERYPHRVWRHTELLVTILPLILLVGMIVVSPRYVAVLMAMERPFLIVNVLPCGWLVFVLVFGLMMASKWLLQYGRSDKFSNRLWVRTGLQGFVLLFITFPALLLILLTPALFQLLRAELLTP